MRDLSDTIRRSCSFTRACSSRTSSRATSSSSSSSATRSVRRVICVRRDADLACAAVNRRSIPSPRAFSTATSSSSSTTRSSNSSFSSAFSVGATAVEARSARARSTLSLSRARSSCASRSCARACSSSSRASTSVTRDWSSRTELRSTSSDSSSACEKGDGLVRVSACVLDVCATIASSSSLILSRSETCSDCAT